MGGMAPTKVIIIDDSNTMREILRSLLISEGFQVVGMQGKGFGLLDEIANKLPDLICLDYHLPDCDGIQLLKQIRSRFPLLPVVMITGSDLTDLEEQATELGAAGFIHKPFTPNVIIQNIKQAIMARGYAGRRKIAVQFGNAEDEPRKTVVVADDSVSMRTLLCVILEEAGFDVVGQATDGAEAIELVEQHQPNLVCLDIEMPEVNGLLALREIHRKHPDVKVLMVTAQADRDCVIRAVNIGASGYIVKPYQPERIFEAIAACQF